ncbi:Homeobox protein B-H1 [Castilleja foliolosa]|uniref:Homeobox protein B-H1 n=1 Tax=Castilleja foliolosa TaxID=1961234 RepID=A0ABD3D003_9LAMI
MGFPVGYTDLFLPKLLVYLLTALGFIRKFVCALFSLLGLGDFLEPETASYAPRAESGSEPRSVSAALIRELLPVVRFSDLAEEEDLELPEGCAVCLYEFAGEDEIRRLANCRHIFHRSCLDRWMDHDQKTCPLCRTQFIPEDMQEAFNEKLWLASGISDFYGEYSPVTADL